MNNVTLVTAFFDIGRELNGDGRKLADYLEWIKKTLQLNCNLFIVTEKKFVDFMKLPFLFDAGNKNAQLLVPILVNT